MCCTPVCGGVPKPPKRSKMLPSQLLISLGGLIAVIAIPGYALSLAVFPKKSFMEHTAFAFVLGLMPILALYILNMMLWVPINAWTVYSTWLLFTLTGIISYYPRRK